jgi:integrase/recombinase XerD
LRHEDVEIAERQITVRPRVNDNGARVKSGRIRTIPTSAELKRPRFSAVPMRVAALG